MVLRTGKSGKHKTATVMLRVGRSGKQTAYIYQKFKKFKDKNNKIYNGNKVILLEDESGKHKNVTLESYNKFRNKKPLKMVIVEEITSWKAQVDNLKISERSGMYKQRWQPPRKNGTPFSTTPKNRGNVKVEKELLVAKNVKKLKKQE